jgi:hypothetical protein
MRVEIGDVRAGSSVGSGAVLKGVLEGVLEVLS